MNNLDKMKNLKYDGGVWIKKGFSDRHPYISTLAVVVAFYAVGFLILKLIG